METTYIPIGRVVTAIQWTGDRFKEPVPEWVQKAMLDRTLCYGWNPGTIVVYDMDANNRFVCKPGDYIALFDGVVTGFREELFEAMFMPVERRLSDIPVNDVLDDVTKPLHRYVER